MAVLDATNRFRVMAQWMRDNLETVSITKADLQATVDATDTWINTNQTAFNLALPLVAQNGLSLTQKTLVFCYVAMRRAGRLKAQEDG